jgi:hypothetical protein
MLYALWDLGFKVGHASRTVEECLRLAREDSTIRTGLVDARLLAGDEKLAKSLHKRVRGEVTRETGAAFVRAKLGERDETTHHLSFSTGVTVSSWGQELDATLTPAAPAGSRVAVRAKPKGTFLTTTWGERIHARTVEKRLRAELTSALG